MERKLKVFSAEGCKYIKKWRPVKLTRGIIYQPCDTESIVTTCGTKIFVQAAHALSVILIKTSINLYDCVDPTSCQRLCWLASNLMLPTFKSQDSSKDSLEWESYLNKIEGLKRPKFQKIGAARIGKKRPLFNLAGKVKFNRLFLTLSRVGRERPPYMVRNCMWYDTGQALRMRKAITGKLNWKGADYIHGTQMF